MDNSTARLFFWELSTELDNKAKTETNKLVQNLLYWWNLISWISKLGAMSNKFDFIYLFTRTFWSYNQITCVPAIVKNLKVGQFAEHPSYLSAVVERLAIGDNSSQQGSTPYLSAWAHTLELLKTLRQTCWFQPTITYVHQLVSYLRMREIIHLQVFEVIR